jgi:uncharacterized membrane protein
MSNAYMILKIAHVISGAIILGTGIGIAFFCWFGYRAALRSRDIGSLRTTLRLTVIADACFTAPAVIFQAVSGAVMMNILGWPWLSAWSITVAASFVLVGACWLPVLAIQAALSRAAQRAQSIEALPESFHRRYRVWFFLGIPAFVTVIAIYYLMVAKPLAVTAISAGLRHDS